MSDADRFEGDESQWADWRVTRQTDRKRKDGRARTGRREESEWDESEERGRETGIGGADANETQGQYDCWPASVAGACVACSRVLMMARCRGGSQEAWSWIWKWLGACVLGEMTSRGK